MNYSQGAEMAVVTGGHRAESVIQQQPQQKSTPRMLQIFSFLFVISLYGFVSSIWVSHFPSNVPDRFSGAFTNTNTNQSELLPRNETNITEIEGAAEKSKDILLPAIFRSPRLGQKPPKVTIFSTGWKFSLLELLALRSWANLSPKREYIRILYFTDENIEQVFVAHGLKHEYERILEQIEIYPTREIKSYLSHPLMNDLFTKAETRAVELKSKWMMYINGDIVLPPNFFLAFSYFSNNMLITGMRLDCNITTDVLESEVLKKGATIESVSSHCMVHGIYGKDYFIYRPGFWGPFPNATLPPFLVGLIKFDDWLFCKAFPNVYDLSPSFLPIHVNHPLKTWKTRAERNYSPETQVNIKIWNDYIKTDWPAASLHYSRSHLCPGEKKSLLPKSSANNMTEQVPGIEVFYWKHLHTRATASKNFKIYRSLQDTWSSPFMNGSFDFAKSLGCF